MITSPKDGAIVITASKDIRVSGTARDIPPGDHHVLRSVQDDQVGEYQAEHCAVECHQPVFRDTGT